MAIDRGSKELKAPDSLPALELDDLAYRLATNPVFGRQLALKSAAVIARAEDRLPIIKSCLEGLHRGEAEPLFIGDIDWAVAEIERLQRENESYRQDWLDSEETAAREVHKRTLLEAESERLRASDEAWKVQLERESARNERLRAVLWKIADDSAHADQYVRWAQEALG